MSPESIMIGRKAIITKAICHPLIIAIRIPLSPMLILVKTEVTLFTNPWWTLEISIYIFEQISAGRLRSCHATYCLIKASKYAFLARIICLSLVMVQAADINHELTNTIALLIKNSLTDSKASLTISCESLFGAKASTNCPNGRA